MLGISRNSAIIFEKRFLLRDKNNQVVETIEGLFHRVAKAIAGAEMNFKTSHRTAEWEAKFYAATTAFDFLPNSPTLLNAGTQLNQLSACFVLPVEDSLQSIFETLKNAAIIQQSGGGTGFNFSQLRPKGDYMARTGGEAAGPVSFMKIFDAVTDHVKQGGRRRGANMGILSIDHPDIIEFIQTKKSGPYLRNFNLSVGITDDFMQAVAKRKKWALKHPGSGELSQEISAIELWKEIVIAAWQCGDPGLVFIDEINRKNPTPGLGPIRATNPCGEVPVLDWEACNLGSINLANMLLFRGKQVSIDWEKLKRIIWLAIRFLDNVIEVNHFPIPQIRVMAMGNRKIGLGVMGWAEMLIHLRIPYDSTKAVKLAGKIMQFIQQESLHASIDLAEERGVFPNWKHSIFYPSLKVRNATRTSIAPTGTISILANTSSSIEPLFALVFDRRNILNGDNLREVNHLLCQELMQRGVVKSEDELADSADQLLSHLPEDILNLYPTAMNISWLYHLKHQLVFQQYTDNAVSKTINLASEATVDDVSKAYMMAWKKGAKGVTLYRNRSKSEQVIYSLDARSEIPTLFHEGLGDCKVCEA